MRLFIDPQGEVWNEAQLVDAAAVGGALHGEALVRYLVVNLGWIDFLVMRQGLKIRARPSILSEASTVALYFVLQDASASPIYLNIFTQSWMTHRFSSIRNLMVFLEDLNIAPQASHWLDDRLLRVSVAPQTSRFAAIVNQAGMVAYNVEDFGRAIQILDRIMPAKWSVCDREGTSDFSRVRAHNGKHQLLDLRSPPADALKNYADPGFARWVSDAHATVLTSMAPRVDQVDAVAKFAELGDVRLRYDVMTIPVTRRDGSRVLICGSIDNCGIDLRQPVQKVA